MTATTLATYPSITVTKAGVPVRLPMQLVPQRGGAGGADLRPVAVARNPKIAFPPPLALGEGSVRRNYDIDEVIFTTWQGGMGEDRYPAATNPTTFQTGRLETRYPGVLACRPLATQVGGAIASVTTFGARVVELSSTTALVYGLGAPAKAYYFDGASWAAIQNGGVDITGITDHVQGQTGIFIAASDIYRSADGATWTKMGKPATTYFLADFDNRIWALPLVPGGTGPQQATIYSSVDLYSAGAGGGTWVAGASVLTATGESAAGLFVWVYPPDKGRSTLWLHTSCRLLYYDYYAATPAWVTWFSAHPPRGGGADVTTIKREVWSKNNNLYAIFDQEYEQVREFTGATITELGPNKRGGLPAGTRLQPAVLAGTDKFLYAWCLPATSDSASLGAFVALAEGGAFHHLLDSTTKTVRGGGVGATKLYTVFQNGANVEVWSQDRGDEATLPQHVTGRTYEANVQTLTTGWITGGLTNVNKRVLYVEIDAIKADGTAGIEAGANITVEYVGRRTGHTVATTLTSASTFPNVVDFSGAYSDKEFQIVVGLRRGTATSASPFLRALKVGYRPRPKQRHTYTVRVDLRDECPAFAESGKFHGYTANYLRQWLDELADNDDAGLDDPLVGLSYGGYGNLVHPRYRSIPQCEVLVQAQESPDRADGLYLLNFNDVSAPTSG